METTHRILAAAALAALAGGCARDTQATGASAAQEEDLTPGMPSQQDLDADEAQRINDANADQEFEQLKQEIEGG